MKAQWEEDRFRRQLVAYYEKKRRKYKAQAQNDRLRIEERNQGWKKLRSLPRNSRRVRIRNRCIFTGRRRAVLRTFRISRIILRKKALEGLLPGVKKASW